MFSNNEEQNKNTHYISDVTSLNKLKGIRETIYLVNREKNFSLHKSYILTRIDGDVLFYLSLKSVKLTLRYVGTDGHFFSLLFFRISHDWI